MRTTQLNLALAAVLLGVASHTVFAQQPTPLITQSAEQCIAVLKSDASLKEKADACRQLAVIGNRDAVPALAALLSDEKLNHMARYALEPIPDPAVDVALREALPNLEGRPLVGVIDSLGVRKDTQAVPALGGLLSDSDPDVVQAAARALGRIGNTAAVTALNRGLRMASKANQAAFCEGLFRCAEAFTTAGEREQALAIYDQLRQLDGPQQVRVGAIRGAILLRGPRAAALVREGLQSDDYLVFAATVRTTYEAPAAGITRVLAAELPNLSSNDRKILVSQALAKRADGAVVPALSAAARSGAKPVRVAAIKALAETGRPAAAPVLVEFLGDSEREVSEAALDSLAALSGPQVDETVRSLLQSQQVQRRLAGIELIGRRRMSACLPDLLKASVDSEAQIRPAALSKVGELGAPTDVPAVLGLLPKLSARQDLDAAEQALSSLCARAERPEACAERLAAVLSESGPGQKGVLLRVLSSVGGPKALEAVRGAVNDSNAEVHGAAIRALGAWKTADAGPDLLALAKNASNPTDQTLCLRSYLGLAANSDVPAAQRLAMCRNASELVKTTDDKRLLLSALGSIDSADSVALIMTYLDDSATKEEASAAVVAIADRMLKGQRAARAASMLIEPLEKVAQATANEELSKRAKTLLQQAQRRRGNQ